MSTTPSDCSPPHPLLIARPQSLKPRLTPALIRDSGDPHLLANLAALGQVKVPTGTFISPDRGVAQRTLKARRDEYTNPRATPPPGMLGAVQMSSMFDELKVSLRMCWLSWLICGQLLWEELAAQELERAGERFERLADGRYEVEMLWRSGMVWTPPTSSCWLSGSTHLLSLERSGLWFKGVSRLRRSWK